MTRASSVPTEAQSARSGHLTGSLASRSVTPPASDVPDDEEPPMDQPIPCPQCGAPAQITERFRLGSTAGPVEHLKTGCVNNHWLTPLAEMVEGSRGPCPPRSRHPC